MNGINKSIGEWATEMDDGGGILARVDRYEFLKELGSGAFGRVYLAKDNVSEDLVALKTIPSELSASANHMEGVKANFTLITKLIHENIANLKFLHKVEKVQTFQPGIHIQQGEYLVIMEYVEGYTLKSWFIANRPVDFAEVVRICREIAKGLDFAHENKIIHRDIKPDNVMLTPNGKVKILDFGMGAEVRSNMSQISNQVTSTSGTVPYMPPEQLNGQRQNYLSDQYSLAVIFYELICGEVPFRSAFDTNDRVLIKDVVTNNAVEELDELTEEQNTVLLKALHKQKKDRFKNCQAFIDALEGKLVQKDSTGVPPVIPGKVDQGKSTGESPMLQGDGKTGGPSATTEKKSKAPLLIIMLLIFALGGWFGFDTYQKSEAERARLENADLKFGSITFKPIPKGSFIMGSYNGDGDEKPVHEVELTQGFWMGETEVTQGQWQSVMGSNPSYFEGDDLSVVKVSWNDCQTFIEKLNRKYADQLPKGYKFALPTEAQWEYACRAGSKGDYAGTLNSMAWYEDNSDSRTHRVGTKKSNAWDLFDMHGNVWEWCQDWYGDYQRGRQKNPVGPQSGTNRVIRGGCWLSLASYCRSAFRGRRSPGYRSGIIGFRLALVPLQFK